MKGTIAWRSRAVLLFERGGREAFGRVAVMTANRSIPRAGRLASGYPSDIEHLHQRHHDWGALLVPGDAAAPGPSRLSGVLE